MQSILKGPAKSAAPALSRLMRYKKRQSKKMGKCRNGYNVEGKKELIL